MLNDDCSLQPFIVCVNTAYDKSSLRRTFHSSTDSSCSATDLAVAACLDLENEGPIFTQKWPKTTFRYVRLLDRHCVTRQASRYTLVCFHTSLSCDQGLDILAVSA